MGLNVILTNHKAYKRILHAKSKDFAKVLRTLTPEILCGLCEIIMNLNTLRKLSITVLPGFKRCRKLIKWFENKQKLKRPGHTELMFEDRLIKLLVKERIGVKEAIRACYSVIFGQLAFCVGNQNE